MKHAILKFVSIALMTQASALEIEIRYDLDNSKFFDQAGAREAMETAASFYEGLIKDELEAIDPNNFQPGATFAWRPTYLEPALGGAETFISDETDLVVPANTLLVYVGARNITAAGRGGPGGVAQFHPEH